MDGLAKMVGLNIEEIAIRTITGEAPEILDKTKCKGIGEFDITSINSTPNQPF